MELVSQIINNLIDDTSSLQNALLKTKVLAKRIGNDSLLEWTNSELAGYKDETLLPDYRRNIWNELKGTMINGNYKYTDIAIPTVGLSKKFNSSLTRTNFTDSISSLENLIKEKGTLGSPLSAETTSLIEANWRNMGNPYLSLISCRKIISKASIVEIITNVRSKLLDFMLLIEKEFDTFTEIKELISKNKEITSIMNQTIINNSGNGNSINTGDNNDIIVNNNILNSNIKYLTKVLEENNVSSEDIKEIEDVILNDNHDYDNKTFGDKTKKWLTKMLGKSVDGSWNIAIGTAGNLLADLLNKFIGF
ncbi:hypothetical protein HX091_06260 [Myroides odoratimimus]|uniref:AbiTii domain-containing protein n=1 Tax=Myroides odoratimimus TaxID=76832 RepID=UPI0025790841|nr:hypothetical protein [Myroides odoratimimus]MDM1525552.1 hypothetical protein [Myroides odoratimimus]